MTVLDSQADGIAEELERPYRTVQLAKEDGVYLLEVTSTKNHQVSKEDAEFLIEDGWTFHESERNRVVFKRESMPFEDDQ